MMSLHRALILALLTTAPMVARGEAPDRPITAPEREHWAFQPPRRPPIPALKTQDWTRNPIDAFILATLEDNELTPSPEADRPTLLRRLTFPDRPATHARRARRL